MKLFNADGSPAEISGNGLRCLGAYLIWSGRCEQEPLRIETDAGIKSSRPEDVKVTVSFWSPTWDVLACERGSSDGDRAIS